MLKLLSRIIIVFIVTFSSCTNCVQEAREFRKVEYNVRIKKMYIKGRQTIFKGVNNIAVLEGQRDDLLEVAQVGDSLIKKYGSTIIKIVKSDTVYEFPAYCSGLPMDEYVR